MLFESIPKNIVRYVQITSEIFNNMDDDIYSELMNLINTYDNSSAKLDEILDLYNKGRDRYIHQLAVEDDWYEPARDTRSSTYEAEAFD